MAKNNSASSIANMRAGVEAGDLDVVSNHAADAGVSVSEFNNAVAETLVVMAKKSEAAAVIVAGSVRGVERLAGGNSHERERASKLRELAQKLRTS